MPIVSNSTPLIALSRIGRLDVLRDHFQEITVPAEVYEELVVQIYERILVKPISRSP